MSKTQLSAEMRSGAEKLAAALMAEGVDVNSVFWTYVDPIEEWRLVIVSSDVSKIGYRDLLINISKKLQKFNGSAVFSLFDIDLRSELDPHIVDLFARLPIRGGGATIKNCYFNENLVSEIYLVRDERPGLSSSGENN